MEGRRSRSKPAENKVEGTQVPTPQPKSADKSAVSSVDKAPGDEDDRSVPMIRGENKRKRAPRGPQGRNLKAKVELGNEQEAKPPVVPTVEEEVSLSNSDDLRGSHVDQSTQKAEKYEGTESGEVLPDNGDEGVNYKEQVEKRRGSSRLRVRPSKFRESFPISSGKVKGEVKNSDEASSSFEIVLPINAINSPMGVPKETLHTSVERSHGVNEAPETLINKALTRKEVKAISILPGNSKDKEPLTSAAAAPRSPDRDGLKAVLTVLKRVMKMKEADPFNKPVDPVVLGVPDYFKVVKKPMDLGTIRDRLEKGEVYRTVEDVFDDVALVWSNCRVYNDDGDPVVNFLQSVESAFHKHCLAAGFPFRAAHGAPGHEPEAAANSNQPKGKQQQEQAEEEQHGESKKSKKKKKTKSARPDAGGLLKTKIKRSAPVEQVMAESKAREQKENAEGVNLGDQDRDVKNAVENSGRLDEMPETSRALRRVEQGPINVESSGDDFVSSQGLVETKAQTVGKKRTSGQPRIVVADVQHVNHMNKSKRPSGHSTLSHRQGCLCVVCVGRRKREAKLKKGKTAADSNQSKSKPKKKVLPVKVKKAVVPNLEDITDRLTYGDMDTGEDLPFTDDAGDALFEDPSSDNVQGYYPASYQLPLRKLAPGLIEMSRVLLGSSPGSLWNRPRSLGYVAVPFSGKRAGFMQVISSLSTAH